MLHVTQKGKLQEWQNELERRSRTFSPCAELVKEADKSLFVSGAEKDTIRVYTSTEFVRRFLTLPNVKLTDSFESADIIWSSQDFSDWDKLKKGQLVNQFKNENCMTFKQRLADLIQYVQKVTWRYLNLRFDWFG